MKGIYVSITEGDLASYAVSLDAQGKETQRMQLQTAAAVAAAAVAVRRARRVAAVVNIAYDFTGDGWADVLNMSGNAGNGTGTLFVNPKGERRRWDAHVVMQPP